MLKVSFARVVRSIIILIAITFEVYEAERHQSSKSRSLIHQLPGRPILVQSSKNTLLEEVNHFTLANRRKFSDGRCLFLVRIETQSFPSLHSILKGLSSFLHYIPHDTFIIALRPEDLDLLWKLGGVVQIFELPPAMKLSQQFYSRKSPQDASNLWDFAANADNCSAAELNLLLSSAPSSSILDEITELCSKVEIERPGTCLVATTSGQKIVVTTDTCSITTTAEVLAVHPGIVWIEERVAVSLRNKYATRIVQGGNGTFGSMWARGLLGDGEVSATRRPCPCTLLYPEPGSESLGWGTEAPKRLAGRNAPSQRMLMSPAKHVLDRQCCQKIRQSR